MKRPMEVIGPALGLLTWMGALLALGSAGHAQTPQCHVEDRPVGYDGYPMPVAVCDGPEQPRPVRDTLEPVRLGVVSYPAFGALANDWHRHDGPGVVERGYCITQWYLSRYPDRDLADSIVRVTRVQQSEDSPTTHGVNTLCMPGTPTLHTHPFDDGYPNCVASKPDYDSAQANGEPFFVIQCDRKTFVFFYRYHGSYRR